MPEWKIKLEGNEEDLERISLLSFNEFEINRDNDGYFLISTKLNNIADPKKAIEAAAKIVDRLNGAKLVRYGVSEKIRTGTLQQIEGNKPPKQYIFPKSFQVPVRFGEMNVDVSNDNDDEVSNHPRNSVEKWMEIGSNNENVRIALELYGSLEHNWKNLYLIFEKIRDDVGNLATLTNKRWVSGRKLSLFKRTANSFEAIGSDARHSTNRHIPPAKPMSIDEARTMIRDLLDKWIKSKFQ